MNATIHLARIDMRLFLGEPIAVFFSYAFPMCMLVLFASVFGADTARLSDGRPLIDFLMPGYLGLVVVSVALPGFIATFAAQRENGLLARLEVSPLQPRQLLVATIVGELAKVVPGVAAVAAVGCVVYGAAPARSFAVVLGAVVLGTSCLIAFGLMLGSVVRTARSGVALGQLAFFPTLFLGGLVIPRGQLPEPVRPVGDVLPGTQVVRLLELAWTGEASGPTWQFVVLPATVAIACVVVPRLLRWGSRR